MGLSSRDFLAPAEDYIFGGPQKREYKRAQKKVDVAYDQATGVLAPAYPAARRQFRRGVKGARREVERGYGEAGQGITQGYAGAREAIGAGERDADARYQDPGYLQAQRNLVRDAMGLGGYSDEEQADMEAGVSDVYGAGARDIVNETSGYRGGSYAPGIRSEEVAGNLGGLTQRRAQDIRGIRMGSAEQARGAKQFATGALMEQANMLSQRDITRGGRLAELSVGEALQMGELSREEAQLLGELEVQTGITMAEMTLGQAQMMANLILERAGTKSQIKRQPSLFDSFVSSAAKGAGEGLGRAGAAAVTEGM